MQPYWHPKHWGWDMLWVLHTHAHHPKPSTIGENANNFENCISVKQALLSRCSILGWKLKPNLVPTNPPKKPPNKANCINYGKIARIGRICFGSVHFRAVLSHDDQRMNRNCFYYHIKTAVTYRFKSVTENPQMEYDQPYSYSPHDL